MIFRIVYCMIAALGLLIPSGFFSLYGSDTVKFDIEPYIFFYTEMSNLLCFVVMIFVLHDNVKRVRAGETQGHNRVLRKLKYISTVIISVTFVVYALVLGEPYTLAFWNSLGNLCYHVFAPFLFILDWFLFEEHKTVKVTDPLLATILPIIYVIYTLIRGSIIHKYPCFFLDVAVMGAGGVAMWIVMLAAFVLVLGYAMFVYDKLVKVDGKWKLDFSR